jgi:heme exporter protein B
VTEGRDIDIVHYCRSQTTRHLMLMVRSPSEVINPLLFFLLVIVLFPLGLGPDPEQLSLLAPGILWVVALLANLMICMRLFVDDFEDGSLEQLAMVRIPLPIAVLPQLLASWLASGLLLSLVSPIFGLMLGLPLDVAPVLVASLLMGTAIMLLLGAVGAALTVGVQRGGILLGASYLTPVRARVNRRYTCVGRSFARRRSYWSHSHYWVLGLPAGYCWRHWPSRRVFASL